MLHLRRLRQLRGKDIELIAECFGIDFFKILKQSRAEAAGHSAAYSCFQSYNAPEYNMGSCLPHFETFERPGHKARR